MLRAIVDLLWWPPKGNRTFCSAIERWCDPLAGQTSNAIPIVVVENYDEPDRRAAEYCECMAKSGKCKWDG